MASPQKENGFTPIANEILEALARTNINGEARRILDVIIRKTYGFQKKKDRIAYSQFRLATGLKKQNVYRGLLKLKNMKIVIQIDDGKATYYQFNKDFDTWKQSSKRITPTPMVIQTDYQRNPNGLPIVIQTDDYNRKKENIQKSQPKKADPSLASIPGVELGCKNIPAPPAEEVKSHTATQFRNERRAEKGKPAHNPWAKMTLKQKKLLMRDKLIGYFRLAVNHTHSKSYFLHPDDIPDIEKKNHQFWRQLKIFFKRCDDDFEKAEKVIKWFAGEYGDWCDYAPDNCFSAKTVIAFENQPKKSTGVVFTAEDAKRYKEKQLGKIND